MARILGAAIAYFGIVFAAGFALGTIRILVLLPMVGELAATLIEGPVILTASWFACRWSVRRFDVSSMVGPRVLMGIVAFGLLMIAEAGLSVLVFGRPLAEHFAAYTTLPVFVGLLGQIVYGLFPLIQLYRSG